MYMWLRLPREFTDWTFASGQYELTYPQIFRARVQYPQIFCARVRASRELTFTSGQYDWPSLIDSTIDLH